MKERKRTFHEDGVTCPVCNGPLDADRDVICHDCSPDSEFEEQMDAAEVMSDRIAALDKDAMVKVHVGHGDGGQCECVFTGNEESEVNPMYCVLGFEDDEKTTPCNIYPGPRCPGPAQPGHEWVLVQRKVTK